MTVPMDPGPSSQLDLSGFLPAGALSFAVCLDPAEGAAAPSPTYAADGWMVFDADGLRPNVRVVCAASPKEESDYNMDDALNNHDHDNGRGGCSSSSSSADNADTGEDGEAAQLLGALRHLVRHRFVAATYCLSRNDARGAPSCRHMHTHKLSVRVYVVPWDLPGSGGRLSLTWRQGNAEKALRTAQKGMRVLFVKITQDEDAWEGRAGKGWEGARWFWPAKVDNRSLLDMYNDLPSPSPTREELARTAHIPGLRTRLHAYQRRTVATLVAREARRGMVDHPLYLPLRGRDGTTFWLQPATMEVVRDRKHVPAVQGGILCEELGTGKTIMMISLVLATLDALPAPEEPASALDEHAPLTPLALGHIPTPAAAAARASLGLTPFRERGVPSLVEHCLHACRVAPPPAHALHAYEDRLRAQHLWEPLMANVPFYVAAVNIGAPASTTGGKRQSRSQSVARPRKLMYLSAATLVVVPDTLQWQWQNEIMKHCEDMALRLLYVDPNKKLPDAPVLATEYDLVLINQKCLHNEVRKKGADSELTFTPCNCMAIGGTRVRKCKCSRRKDVSPLRQIRWKRLIVDEGHNTAQKRTDYAMFTNSLSVECKWAVTGTPTSSLLGLNFGTLSEVPYAEDAVPELDLAYPEDDDNANSDDDGLYGPHSEAPHNVRQRRWHKSERADFPKLATMFGDFLGMAPFAQDSGAFSSFVTQPIFDHEGPFPQDIEVLQKVMESMMVRHQIADVEKDVVLPILHNETVLLDMDPYAVMTYNVMQAMIAVNAVDSERRDQDYFFHPSSVGPLRQLVGNLSQSLFWHTIDMKDVDDARDHAPSSLKRAFERGAHPSDIKLVEESLKHLEIACNNLIWVELQGPFFHVSHRVKNMPQNIVHAWSMLTPEALATSNSDSFLTSSALCRIREDLDRVPPREVSSVKAITTLGEQFSQEERLWADCEKLRPKQLTKKEKADARENRKAGKGVYALPASERKVLYERKVQQYKEISSLRPGEEGKVSGKKSPVKKPNGMEHSGIRRTFMACSPVKDVRIRTSTSTKLDYLLNEVLVHSPREKFLIFSASVATLSFVSEGLDLVGIPHLKFSGPHRQSMPTTFATSEKCRVLLMELNSSNARGLNLVAASRVIFCEPVWKADVQSQAIKRVHRIGQTRPVVVKTLAIRGTYEEVMDARFKALKDRKETSTNDPTDDLTVRRFIENPVFMPPPASERVQIDIPLFNLTVPRPPPSLLPVEVVADSTTTDSPPLKKPRLVRFAGYDE